MFVFRRLLSRVVSAFWILYLKIKWSPKSSVAYAKWLGVDVVDGAEIFNGVSFGSEPWLIRIGAMSRITSGVAFVTHDGAISVVKNLLKNKENARSINRFKRIIIGDNCFIGIRSIIMPGVVIGNNSIVAAGSVVVKDVEEGSIVGGNPAKVIGRLDQYRDKVIRESLNLTDERTNERQKRNQVLAALATFELHRRIK